MVTIKKIQKIANTGENVEQLEPWCTIDGNVKWGGHHGKLLVSFSKN